MRARDTFAEPPAPRFSRAGCHFIDERSTLQYCNRPKKEIKSLCLRAMQSLSVEMILDCQFVVE